MGFGTTLYTDIYFSKDLKEVGFVHQKYGHLDSYGATTTPIENFSEDFNNVLKKIHFAIIKAKNSFLKRSQTIPHYRGC